MVYRTSWEYVVDTCSPTPKSKPTLMENFLDMPEYVKKLNLLLSLVPTELDDADLDQAWIDIASFQTTIKDFYDCEFKEYSRDLNDLVAGLMSKTRVQREAIEAEVSRRGLQDAFRNLQPWEPEWRREFPCLYLR